ncbi:MAG: RraA family protein [SAR202 cluster bacterium]|jgi:regulator of RNase E activity RraA|nr:RraA family protein [SAR202 cluster bacterium]MDP6274120.1 RraA family protein [Dehalococcoidia bacterium]MDP7161750.1 RraA family protein [Dehalococcoidia bacterium]MDP7226041.1 RraA family protein [SAR202 cluster bacterium]HJO80808.1 RraA family protein [SAR202 cluster bacterium]|tara:strand:+ start:184 stop:1002 length:819 start_codon:yes stop_codon:yes gene_type:complete
MRLTNPDIIKAITSHWKGDRDPNGRPLVPDDILQRMEDVTTEEAWDVLQRNGYTEQFEGGWKVLRPDHVLVGRAVTCRYVPGRPDIEEAVNALGEREGRIGSQNSWAIDELVKDDVIVVDLFGKIRDGGFAGDNLSTAIKVKTNRGMVIDGTDRDVQGILKIPEFGVFVRDWHPSAFADVTMVEINGITRIGGVTCLPGDVVLGTVTGVIFIPPHLAQEVVEYSEETRARDEFGQQRIAEGVYTPGEVDRVFSEEMERDFQQWRANRDISDT